ncbi:MAG: restriction endonuclease subunit S, partial [Bacteroidetes bacterium]|nr:restriction endonuclease subunit S [Bacteroidota bacterium]
MVDGWKTYKLGEVANIQNGYAFKSKELGSKGIPVIKIKNIIPPSIDLDAAACYSGNIDDKLKKYIIRKNDFLISMTGSTVNVMTSAVGKMGRYRHDDIALLNQRVGKVYVTDPEKVDFGYLCLYLNRYEIHYGLALNATGSANQANISPAQIKDIDLYLPPLPEQKAIAAILSALDDKIELNLQTNQTLEEMAMALYKHWFVDFGPFQDGNFVDSELGMIPEGWEVKRIEDITTLQYGKALKKTDRIPGEFPVYGSSGNVGNNINYLIEGPSLIIGRKGNVGSVFWEERKAYPIDTVYYINGLHRNILRFLFFKFLTTDFKNTNSDSVVPG